MLVIRTKDNGKTFDLAGIIVKDADELKAKMEKEPERFNAEYTYFPVKIGKGRQLEKLTTTRAKEVELNA